MSFCVLSLVVINNKTIRNLRPARPLLPHKKVNAVVPPVHCIDALSSSLLPNPFRVTLQA